MRRRSVVVGLVLIVTVAAGWRPAFADTIDGGSGGYAGGSSTDDGGQVVVAVPGSSSQTWPAGGYKKGAGSNIECGYFTTTSIQGGVLPDVGERLTDTSTVAAGTYLWLICRDADTGEITFENIFAWDPAAPPLLTPPAAVLAQMAVNSVRLPKPGVRTWPRTGGVGLVNLPVWLHVENWAVVSASATAGGLTATVEASPVRVEWNMDEGSLTCTDPGSTYDVDLEPDPTSSSCSYTYRHSSGVKADGTFHDASVIVWHLRWTATNGEGGDLGEMAGPPTPFALRIQESQAVIVPAGN